jgi:hypothetical protein
MVGADGYDPSRCSLSGRSRALIRRTRSPEPTPRGVWRTGAASGNRNRVPRLADSCLTTRRWPQIGAHNWWTARELNSAETRSCKDRRHSSARRPKFSKRRSLQPGLHRSRARGFRRTCRVWRRAEAAPKANDQNKKPSAGYAREGSDDLSIMRRGIYPLELLPGPRRSRQFSGMPCPNATAWNACREPGFRHGRPLRGAAVACAMVVVLIMGRGFSHNLDGFVKSDF